MVMVMAMAIMKQQRSKLNWERMLKRCCLSAHSNGTHRPAAHSDGTHHPPVLPKWRGNSSGGNVYDHPAGTNRSEPYLRKGNVVSGVYEIAQYFKFLDPAQIEEWVDVLQRSAESIDLAQELHSIGCLVHLLYNMLPYSGSASIRAKTAELVTTMVHNNPRNQQLLLELGVLKPLFHVLSADHDATSRTKALGAISALILNNKPSITTFQEYGGYSILCDALSTETESVVLQRDALNLIQYLLHENSLDCNTVHELGLPHIMMHLATSDDAEVREAALRGLVLARHEGGQLVKNDDKVKQVLEERIERISAMSPEDRVAAREEIQLVDSLWYACYGEEGQLLVLPGEDATAPDVASMQFEPPPGPWAAAEATDRNSVGEKKDCNIVTEVGLPRMIHLASSNDAEVRVAALRGLVERARDEEGGSWGTGKK